MKRKIILILLFFCISIIRLYAENIENVPTGGGYPVTTEGAWCWFADPRALHYEKQGRDYQYDIYRLYRHSWQYQGDAV